MIYRFADDGYSYQFINGGTASLTPPTAIDDVLTSSGTIVFSVNPINDPPEFTVVGDLLVREDEDRVSAGAVAGQPGTLSIPNFLTGIRPGPLSATDEAVPNQNVVFKLSVNNPHCLRQAVALLISRFRQPVR